MDGFYTDDYKRVWGNVQINGDKVITSINNSLVIKGDSVTTYTITLAEGIYNTERTSNYSELVTELNTQFTSTSAPIEALLGGYHKDEKYNVIVFKMTNGEDIQAISGTFFDEFFENV